MLKLFQKSAVVSPEDITKAVGDSAPGVLRALQGIVVARIKPDTGSYGCVVSMDYKVTGYQIADHAEYQRIMREYRKDIVRFWFPVVISILALVVSVIALVRTF